MTRPSLQQKNINANFIACELTFKRVDTFGVLLRNEFDFWKVHGIMNTSLLLQSK